MLMKNQFKLHIKKPLKVFIFSALFIIGGYICNAASQPNISYYSTFGQTVIFDLKAGAKAPWDKNALDANKSNPIKKPSATLAVRIDRSAGVILIDFHRPTEGGIFELFSINGKKGLTCPVEAGSSRINVRIRQLPEGQYFSRLSIKKMPVQTSRLLLVR